MERQSGFNLGLGMSGAALTNMHANGRVQPALTLSDRFNNPRPRCPRESHQCNRADISPSRGSVGKFIQELFDFIERRSPNANLLARSTRTSPPHMMRSSISQA
jgi:hypothetical protein